MKTALPTLLLMLLTSCSTTGKDGTKHYYVLGFGVVSVNNTKSSASVCRMRTVGLGVSSAPGLWAGLGYADSTTVVIPTTNSVLIEVK